MQRGIGGENGIMNDRATAVAASPVEYRMSGAVASLVAVLIGYLLLNLSFNSIAEEVSRKWPPDPVALTAMVIAMGIMLSEIALACVAIVWGQGRFVGRLLAVWFLGLIGLGAWAMSLLDAAQAVDSDEAQLLRFWFAAMPCVVLAIQVPLWLLRLYFGWRAVHRSTTTTSDTPLSIRDILMGTAITAVSLSLVRFSATWGQEVDAGFWLAWGIAALCLSAIGLLVISPLVLTTLYFRSTLVALVSSATYAVIAGLGATLILVAFVPDVLKDSDFPLILTLLIVCPLAILVPLLIARLAGYRLVMGRGLPTADGAECNIAAAEKLGP
jgi:hypothetical protein